VPIVCIFKIYVHIVLIGGFECVVSGFLCYLSDASVAGVLFVMMMMMAAIIQSLFVVYNHATIAQVVRITSEAMPRRCVLAIFLYFDVIALSSSCNSFVLYSVGVLQPICV